MSGSRRIALLALLACGGAQADTLEGHWQDTERRILYSREAPPGYQYGNWTAIEQDQTYPSAKEIRRSGAGLEVLDLNADDDNYVVKTVKSTDDSVVFVREVKWSGCAMHHRCTLEGPNMFCALENVCPQDGKAVVDWRGEERYARRVSCERQGRVQAQGFPVSCR